MPLVDSIRRESHAATQGVFQPVLTQNYMCIGGLAKWLCPIQVEV